MQHSATYSTFRRLDRRICTQYPTPDIEAYARAAGCDAFKITNPKDLAEALKTAVSSCKPSVVEVITKIDAHFQAHDVRKESRLMEHYRIYLNGEWVDSQKIIPVRNPATGEVFADVAAVGGDNVRKAIEDAGASFPAWSGLPAIKRGDYLLAIAREMTSRADKIARTITMENGKPLAQSMAEVAMTIDHFRWFAEEGRRAYGRWVPNQADSKRHIVMKNPVGVVGAISPWNFPLNLAVRKVAPALAAGCPIILKPSSLTPLSAIELAECVDAAGVPKGIFQLVVGNSSEIASEMLNNSVCRKVSFTGSSAVGKLLIAGAAKTCTSLSLELGGKRAFDRLRGRRFRQGHRGRSDRKVPQHRTVLRCGQPHILTAPDLR